MKIISGGQTGSDQAGLQAGKALGLETGGWIPKGFKTEKGSQYELQELYNLKEHTSDHYVPRTFANVKDSDGTIRIAKNFNSPGEKCTLKAILQYERPYIDVSMSDPRPISEVVAWLRENKIETLNVAGNRESTAPGIAAFAEEYLMQVIKEIKNEKSVDEEG
tara:strand:- start:42365 stop:42853 length:489 start_codon:yes stop_codon:yes gene_type:complete